MWPLVERFNEAGAARVFADVEPGGLMIRIGPDPVVEVITLPRNAELGRDITFPVTQHAIHTMGFFPRKRDQGVKVVWHKKDHFGKPSPVIVKESDRIEQSGRGVTRGEVVQTTRFAIDGNEEDRVR
ncbi:MAG: hypothetical protein WCS43_13035 [Verrucomicrobiota bacterium]